MGAWRDKLRSIRAEERGQAMVEYIIVSLPGFIIAAFLYYPGNGLYAMLRLRFDLAYWLCFFPGP
jgi:hypothetical protein